MLKFLSTGSDTFEISTGKYGSSHL